MVVSNQTPTQGDKMSSNELGQRIQEDVKIYSVLIIPAVMYILLLAGMLVTKLTGVKLLPEPTHPFALGIYIGLIALCLGIEIFILILTFASPDFIFSQKNAKGMPIVSIGMTLIPMFHDFFQGYAEVAFTFQQVFACLLVLWIAGIHYVLLSPTIIFPKALMWSQRFNSRGKYDSNLMKTKLNHSLNTNLIPIVIIPFGLIILIRFAMMLIGNSRIPDVVHILDITCIAVHGIAAIILLISICSYVIQGKRFIKNNLDDNKTLQFKRTK